MTFRDTLIRAKLGDETAKLEILEKYKPMLIKNSILNTSTDTRRGCPKSSADRKKPSRPEGLAYGQAGEEQDTKIAFLQLPFAAFRNAYS